MKICATGHRPQSLPGGFSPTTHALMVQIAGEWFDDHPEVSEVIVGMALGWDQAVAKAALDRMLPVHAYVPFIGQADAWGKAACEDYTRLLAQCASIRVVSPGGYSAAKMQRRNESMVDDAEEVLALWDGKPNGGTANTVAYAMMEGKEVHNVWDMFLL